MWKVSSLYYKGHKWPIFALNFSTIYNLECAYDCVVMSQLTVYCMVIYDDIIICKAAYMCLFTENNSFCSITIYS